jgi:hypothetical protein
MENSTILFTNNIDLNKDDYNNNFMNSNIFN